MKKLSALIVTVLFALSLGGCAAHSGAKQTVKCPACGYEFEVPATQ